MTAEKLPSARRRAQPPSAGSAVLTLADLDRKLLGLPDLSPVRRRDLRSAVARVAALIGEEPNQLQIDLAYLSSKLAKVNAVAKGVTAKRLSNIRSDFLAAVRESGLSPTATSAPMSLEWAQLFATLPDKRSSIGLSRLARYASALGIAPNEITQTIVSGFVADVREGSLHRNPNELHRRTILIWNEIAAAFPKFGLRRMSEPSFRRPPKRVTWAQLSSDFRQDVENYLAWCECTDPFADDARSRPLAARTLKLRRNQIHAAVTALIESGVAPAAIKCLADLVTVDHFRHILRRRHQLVGEQENSFNRNLAEFLIRIAKEWVKLPALLQVELSGLTSKVPTPAAGLTSKNKRLLRQFDNPVKMKRVLSLSNELWAEVKRERNPNFRTLAKAQAAIAIAILIYMPLRMQNLRSLAFDIHLFLRDESRPISTLELSKGEVKNNIELAFDIPEHLAKMMTDFRERIAPKIMGRRPERLFVNEDGSLKTAGALGDLIQRYLRKRAGINITPHQFRHLAAKNLLDAEPGSYETVRQLLGHRNLKTTVGFYAGSDSRRAGRHHQQLLEAALSSQGPCEHVRRTRSDQAIER
jgi:integrase